MKKKLISLAVASALATPMVASAQSTHVTMFGSVQAEYSTVDIEGISSQAHVGDDTGRSKWGLHVVEDLGGGLKAKVHVEYGFSTGSGNLGMARERWAALANNDWGEIKFGRVQSPFKDFAGGMTIDPFAYTSLQAGGSGGTMTASANGLGAGANGFVNSALRYDSPTVDGFTFSGLLMPGDSRRFDPTSLGGAPVGLGVNPTNSGGEDGEWDFQIAGTYEMEIEGHDITVFGGYSRDNISTVQKTFGVLKDEEVWRGGATWSYQNFRIRGQYENIQNAVGASTCTTAGMLGAQQPTLAGLPLGDTRAQCNSAMNLNGDGDIWFVGGEYIVGDTRLIAQGGMANANKVSGVAFSSSREVSSFTVGAIHNLSKRSSLFGGYQRTMVDDTNFVADSDANKYTIGIRHDF